MPTRTEIIATARALVDTPWRHQGRIPGVGIDCIGVPMVVGIKLEVITSDILKIEELNNYGRSYVPGRLVEYAEKYLISIPVEDAKPGSVVICAFEKGGERHMGILSDLGVIHADSRIGRVVEHCVDQRWKNYIIRAYDFPGVT